MRVRHMMKRQEGLTGISILIIVMFLVFVASLALKVVPVYADDSAIKSIVASFDNKGDMRGKTKKMVTDAFIKRMKINNVMLEKDQWSLTKKDGDFLLVVDYEPRGELIGSLEFIVHFHHEAKFAAN